MIKSKVFGLAILFIFDLTMSNVSLALTAGKTQLRIQTGEPKRNGETAFSYMVTWRKGSSIVHRANGLTFVNGSDTKKPTSAVEIARKITNSVNASIDYDAPSERGAIAKNNKDKAEVLVSNRNGFDLAHITTRDYSNQKLNYNIPGKSFKAASVGIAIDLVYSAAVEYVDGFSSGIKQETAGGLVRVTIDNNQPIEIKTDGKSAEQIENELAQALGSIARFSSKSLYPNFTERKSRNYKPFDGGEVQLLNLSAQSITVDVNDSGLGALVKFDFPDINKPTDVAGNINYIVGLLLACVFGYFFYISKIKAKKEETRV